MGRCNVVISNITEKADKFFFLLLEMFQIWLANLFIKYLGQMISK